MKRSKLTTPVNRFQDYAGDLWDVAKKLRGLGEVFSMATGEPPFSEMGLKGIADQLLELSQEVNTIGENLHSE